VREGASAPRALTALDALIDELAGGIAGLTPRSVVALFSSCALALLPEFRRWAAHTGASEELLQRALAVADRFAVAGTAPARAGLAELLEDFAASTPPGESPDAVVSTFAQDCWICADACVRVLVEDSYTAGVAIEYALEPVVSTASQRLFGVSQVGSGDQEERQIRTILADPAVVAAAEYLRWAIATLAERPAPTAEELALVRARFHALAP
jgi:hypothetical protein